MADAITHMGDTGSIFEVTIMDYSLSTPTIVDVGAMTTSYFAFTRPDGVQTKYEVVLTTDGSDGKVNYVTVGTEFDTVGLWAWDCFIDMTSVKYNTDTLTIDVRKSMA